MGLSYKQEAFIDEYIITLNASEAARRSGYKGKANVVGPRLLANVSIKEEIERRLKEKHLTADMVLSRLADMATGNLSDFANIKDSDALADSREQGYLVKKFKCKVTRTRSGDEYEDIELELYDAQRALETIGKHLGLFTDKIEHNITGSLNITSIDIANAVSELTQWEASRFSDD